jgi:hypothetical protein
LLAEEASPDFRVRSLGTFPGVALR